MVRRYGEKNYPLIFIGSVLCFFLPFMFGYHSYLEYKFNYGCGDYLKLAADANSIQLARQHVDTALNYVRAHELTSGNTAVFFPSPQTDVGLWYRNLQEVEKDLHTFPANSTKTDENTALVKLRESLVDHVRGGDVVTVPPDIGIHPNITLFYFTMGLSIFSAGVGALFITAGAIDG